MTPTRFFVIRCFVVPLAVGGLLFSVRVNSGTVLSGPTVHVDACDAGHEIGFVAGAGIGTESLDASRRIRSRQGFRSAAVPKLTTSRNSERMPARVLKSFMLSFPLSGTRVFTHRCPLLGIEPRAIRA
jgi:hypothetical protein